MQYITNSMKAGKPYRQRRMTPANCAVDVTKQAVMYAEWANEQGLTQVHVYAPSLGRYRNECVAALMDSLHGDCVLQFCDPEEWK